YTKKGALEAEAFAAGMDVLCFSEHPAEGVAAILDTADPRRIEESIQRVWALKQKSFSQPDGTCTKGTDLADLHQRSARGSLTEIYGDPCLAKHIREGDFLNLSLGRPGANIFSQGLEQAYGTPALAVETESGRLDGLLGTKDGLV